MGVGYCMGGVGGGWCVVGVDWVVGGVVGVFV